MMHDDMQMENEARQKSLHGLMDAMDGDIAKTLTKGGVPVLTIKIAMEQDADNQQEEQQEPGNYDDSRDAFPGGPNGPAETPIMALIKRKKAERGAGA